MTTGVNDLTLHMGHIIPMGQSDLKADDATPKYAKGQLSFVRDDYGLRIFRYLHNQVGGGVGTTAAKRGGLYRRVATVSVTLGASSGSTTTLIKKAGAWTANALLGRMYCHRTNATTGGAAPEGETGIVVANTADQLVLDSARPLSAAPSVGADVTDVVALFDFEIGAATDVAVDVFGVAQVAISPVNWGVLQVYGMCPDVLVKSATAIAANGQISPDVEQVTVGAAGTRFWIGYAKYAINNPNALLGTFFLDLFSPVGPAATA